MPFETRQDGTKWFVEYGLGMWPGQAMSIEVTEVLHEEKTEFQDLVVFQSKTYGRVLVLDGAIQLTERDEFAYHEMMAHLPLFAHPNPEKVLIIGGGDGGVMGQVLLHSSVKSVDLCDIDEKVTINSKKWFPQIAASFSDPRAKAHHTDGFKFLQERKNEYDIIIVDSSDPIGPAESLFQKPFYDLLNGALRQGGIVCTQGECVWLHLDLIAEMASFCKTIFPKVDYAYTTIPTYPSGQIGFVLCSKNPNTNFRANRIMPRDMAEKMRYYTGDIHRASFVLPAFAANKLRL